MEFGDWLVLNEGDSIADNLKSMHHTQVKKYKTPIRDFLVAQHMPQRAVDLFVNFLSHLYISENLAPEEVPATLTRDWQHWGDYFHASLNQRQKFATAATREQLDGRVAEYHRDLQLGAKNRRKGPEGLVIAEVPQGLFKLTESGLRLPEIFNPYVWQGWKWVSLGAGSSREEAAAAGHCGNSGAAAGDNIVSLRDPKGKVHLTFIVNTYTGDLGEAKGVNNDKPESGYHPAIVSLLLSPYVKGYKGQGYKPEHNFHPQDIEDNVLRSYITDLLDYRTATEQQHEVPENYRQLQWIEQWTQDRVDALSPEDKLKLMRDIAEIFENHKPLNAYSGYDEDDEPILKTDAYVPKIHFDINKLLADVIPAVKNRKHVLKVMHAISRISTANEMGHVNDVKVFHPDKYEEPEEGEPSFKKEWSDLVKSEALKVDMSIFDRFIKQGIRQLAQGSLREKLSLIEELESVGYRDEEYTDENGHHDWREWNVYQKHLDDLYKDVLENVVKKGSIPPSLVYEITNILGSFTAERRRMDHLIPYVELSQDGKKVLLGMNTYPLEQSLTSAFEETNRLGQRVHRVGVGKKKEVDPRSKKLKEHVEKLLEKKMPELKRRGYSPYLSGATRSNPLGGSLPRLLAEKFGKYLFEAFGRNMKQMYPKNFKAKPKRTHDSGYVYFMDAIDYIKEILAGESNLTADTIRTQALRVFERSFNNLLKQLPQILNKEMDELIETANNPQEYSRKQQEYVPIPRSHIRRHAGV
jgi:hypothetical protein